jgi:hypothetical protein
MNAWSRRDLDTGRYSHPLRHADVYPRLGLQHPYTHTFSHALTLHHLPPLYTAFFPPFSLLSAPPLVVSPSSHIPDSASGVPFSRDDDSARPTTMSDSNSDGQSIETRWFTMTSQALNVASGILLPVFAAEAPSVGTFV